MSNKTRTAAKLSAAGLAGVFLTVFLYMSDLTYYPAFYGTMMAFPEADMGVLNFIMTGSQLTAAVSAFAVIPLMRRFSKKALLLALTAIFAVFAICTPLVNDVWFVAIMRTLSGLGFGGIMGVSVSLLQQVYRDNAQKRDRLVGYYNGFMSLAGAVNGLAGGFLAAISWDAVFRFYWIAVPIFLIIALFVPKTPADKEAIASDAIDSTLKEPVVGWQGTLPKVIAATIAYAVISCVYLACGSGQLSIIVQELGFGGEELAGTITAFTACVGFVAGLLFAPAFHKFGRFLPVGMLTLMALGVGLYCIHANVVFIYAGFALDAFAYAGGLSYYMVYAAESVPPIKASTAITIVTIGMTLGSFASPYMVTAIQGALNTMEVMPIYPVLEIIVVAGVIISLVLAVRSKRSGGENGAPETTSE